MSRVIKKVGTHTAQQQNNNAKSNRTSVSTNNNVPQNNTNVKHSVDDVIDKNHDLRFSKDDTIVDYSDLTALDDEEIKAYNKRGWTYKLFTKEDRILLREKFNEPDSKITSRTDNVLGDGSRIVEVNNKIVLIGGTFAEPEIYCVVLFRFGRHRHDLRSAAFPNDTLHCFFRCYCSECVYHRSITRLLSDFSLTDNLDTYVSSAYNPVVCIHRRRLK